jgi:hypothetical protein
VSSASNSPIFPFDLHPLSHLPAHLRGRHRHDRHERACPPAQPTTPAASSSSSASLASSPSAAAAPPPKSRVPDTIVDLRRLPCRFSSPDRACLCCRPGAALPRLHVCVRRQAACPASSPCEQQQRSRFSRSTAHQGPAERVQLQAPTRCPRQRPPSRISAASSSRASCTASPNSSSAALCAQASTFQHQRQHTAVCLRASKQATKTSRVCACILGLEPSTCLLTSQLALVRACVSLYHAARPFRRPSHLDNNHKVAWWFVLLSCLQDRFLIR